MALDAILFLHVSCITKSTQCCNLLSEKKITDAIMEAIFFLDNFLFFFGNSGMLNPLWPRLEPGWRTAVPPLPPSHGRLVILSLSTNLSAMF